MVTQTRTQNWPDDTGRRSGEPAGDAARWRTPRPGPADEPASPDARRRGPRPGAGAGAVSLDEIVQRFMKSCRHVSRRTGRPLSPKTIEYYQMCLDGLLFFARREQWPPTDQLTRDHLRDFMDYLDTEAHRWDGDGRRCTYQQASPATVHHYMKVTKTLFTWAVEEQYLRESPAMTLRLPNPRYEEIEPYSDEEIAALLATCEGDIQRRNRYLGVRNKAIVSIFIDTGLRLTELADMKLSELDPALQQVRILGKGNKWRTVPINGEAKKALKTYLTQYRPSIPGEDAVWLTDDAQPMTSDGVRMVIDRLKVRARVTSGGSAHRFRHYYATRYLENGGDINTLRLLLGHSTLYMVLRYTRFVEGRRALASSQPYSPLDRLTRGEKGSHRDENWGWRT